MCPFCHEGMGRVNEFLKCQTCNTAFELLGNITWDEFRVRNQPKNSALDDTLLTMTRKLYQILADTKTIGHDWGFPNVAKLASECIEILDKHIK